MIFYFSGTGNSLYAAKNIANAQNEALVSIAKEMDKGKEELKYKLAKDELLGFVYPVYAWGPPKIVIDFIRIMKIEACNAYIFSLSTCGDEEGRTTYILNKALNEKGLSLDSAFTIQMPNNYILGFNIDPIDVEALKLERAEIKLTEINKIISERQSGVNMTIPGKLAKIKSSFVNPLFNKFAVNTKNFYVTDDCKKCGLCETICPVHTININIKPIWGKSCTQCLACINSCPERAIQCGKGTLRKGRYVHPDLRVNDKNT